MTNVFAMPRDELLRALGNPRLVVHLEKLALATNENTEAVTANVADTAVLKDAAFVTLSANAELPNERVLSFGPGVKGEIGASSLRIGLDRNVPQVTGGFSATFVAAGDSRLGLPPAGTLATQEWVNAQGFGGGGSLSGAGFSIDDGSASGGGGFAFDDGGA